MPERGGSSGGGPNAVKSVLLKASTMRNYCYDANGNLTGDTASLQVRYDHDNVPTRIDRSLSWNELRYDQNGQRFRQRSSDGFDRLYVGNGFEREFSPLTGVWSSRIYVGKSTVIVRQPNGTRRVDYLLNDRLGSVDTVTDANGLVKEKRGYDAFGKPRNGDWTDCLPPMLGTASVDNTPKGFTQHEHLDAVKLIHMNGRVYDYELGRFLSVDPVVQLPTNSQSINPYSYVLNNPLSGTDPTGYACEDIAETGNCIVKVKTLESRIPKNVTIKVVDSNAGASGGSGGVSVSGGGAGQSSGGSAASRSDPRGATSGDATRQVNATGNRPTGTGGPTLAGVTVFGISLAPSIPGRPAIPWAVPRPGVGGPAVIGVLLLITNNNTFMQTIGAQPVGCGGALCELNSTDENGDGIREPTPQPKGESVPPVPGAKPGRETKGRTTQWEKPGGAAQADTDFDGLNPHGVDTLPNGGRKGTLPNGQTVIVRPTSTDGRPTLEIQDGKKRTKVRYDQ